MYGITGNSPLEIERAKGEDVQALCYLMREVKGRSRLTIEQLAVVAGFSAKRIKALLDGGAPDVTVAEVSVVISACGYRLWSSISTLASGPIPPWTLYRVVRTVPGPDFGRALGIISLMPTWQDAEVLSELVLQGFLEAETPKQAISKIVVREFGTNCYSMQVNAEEGQRLRLDYVGTLNSVVPTVGEGSR